MCHCHGIIAHNYSMKWIIVCTYLFAAISSILLERHEQSSGEVESTLGGGTYNNYATGAYIRRMGSIPGDRREATDRGACRPVNQLNSTGAAHASRTFQCCTTCADQQRTNYCNCYNYNSWNQASARTWTSVWDTRRTCSWISLPESKYHRFL